MKILEYLNKSLGVYNIKGVGIEPTYWQAGAILFLLFLLVFTLARLRYLYIHWSLGRSSLSMLFWGFILAIIVEGFLIVSGRTLLTTILGWDNAPKPISTALDIGRERLVDVLGASDEVSEEDLEMSVTEILLNYQTLQEDEAEIIRSFVCKP
jgi:hypothetical protein